MPERILSQTAAAVQTRLYRSQRPFCKTWEGMRQRCYNQNSKDYPRYGGRGITVCEEWLRSYEAFYAWVLTQHPPPGHSLDRIDVNGNYEPENCRFASPRTQSNNRRATIFLTAFGETKPASLWLEDPRCTVSKFGLYNRLNNGLSPEEALTKSPHPIRVIEKRLAPETAIEIYNDIANGVSIKSLALKHKTHERIVSGIAKGTRFRDLGLKQLTITRGGRPKSFKSPQ